MKFYHVEYGRDEAFLCLDCTAKREWEYANFYAREANLAEALAEGECEHCGEPVMLDWIDQLFNPED